LPNYIRKEERPSPSLTKSPDKKKQEQQSMIHDYLTQQEHLEKKFQILDKKASSIEKKLQFQKDHT
jgi:GTP-binding protein EngB required for normal cell division